MIIPSFKANLAKITIYLTIHPNQSTITSNIQERIEKPKLDGAPAR